MTAYGLAPDPLSIPPINLTTNPPEARCPGLVTSSGSAWLRPTSITGPRILPHHSSLSPFVAMPIRHSDGNLDDQQSEIATPTSLRDELGRDAQPLHFYLTISMSGNAQLLSR